MELEQARNSDAQLIGVNWKDCQELWAPRALTTALWVRQCRNTAEMRWKLCQQTLNTDCWFEFFVQITERQISLHFMRHAVLGCLCAFVYRTSLNVVVFLSCCWFSESFSTKSISPRTCRHRRRSRGDRGIGPPTFRTGG